MRSNPGYEPSVRSVLEHALPRGAHVLAGSAQLHFRVSYPLVVRATGLGRLEGGELILTPPARAGEILERAGELARLGVSGIIVAGMPVEDGPAPWTDASVPIIALPEGTSVQSAREAIDRHIVRRRRELFTLEQRLHRSLVDAAIGGASAERLLQVAAEESGALVWLDRGGDITWMPGDSPAPGPEARARALEALTRDTRGRVVWDGPPRLLSMEVSAGAGRRGIVAAAADKDGRYEEDEAMLAALASGMAIVLAREPELQIPTMDALLGPSGALMELGVDHAGRPWVALAVLPVEGSIDNLYRSLGADLNARSVPYVAGRSGDALVVLVAAAGAASRDSLASSLPRAASGAYAAGLGRPYEGVRGAARSLEEALLALGRVDSGLARFEEVELAVVLASVSGRDGFIAARLGPLLGGGPVQTELLDTIRAYLAAGRNAKEAAQRLQVHRNTLLYRLRRVEGLLGLDWTDADAVFAVDLALRLLSLDRTGLRADADSD